MGRSKLPRFYAFVFVKGQDPQTEDLNAILVSNGLARIHGVKAAFPDGESIQDLLRIYEDLENEAKDGGFGAWSKGEEIRRKW